MKDIAGEIINSLCEGLEEGIDNYQIIFKLCTKKIIERCNNMPNNMFGEDYWKMMETCYQ